MVVAKGFPGVREPVAASGGEPRKRRFYYLVKTDAPTVEQFRSYYARGLMPPITKGSAIERYKSVSLWETPEQARACAARMKREHFGFIAILDIPEDVPVVRRGRHEGHHEIHQDIAPPERLHGWLAGIMPVR